VNPDNNVAVLLDNSASSRFPVPGLIRVEDGRFLEMSGLSPYYSPGKEYWDCEPISSEELQSAGIDQDTVRKYFMLKPDGNYYLREDLRLDTPLIVELNKKLAGVKKPITNRIVCTLKDNLAEEQIRSLAGLLFPLRYEFQMMINPGEFQLPSGAGFRYETLLEELPEDMAAVYNGIKTNKSFSGLEKAKYVFKMLFPESDFLAVQDVYTDMSAIDTLNTAGTEFETNGRTLARFVFEGGSQRNISSEFKNILFILLVRDLGFDARMLSGYLDEDNDGKFMSADALVVCQFIIDGNIYYADTGKKHIWNIKGRPIV
jgi:hypothetical protein